MKNVLEELKAFLASLAHAAVDHSSRLYESGKVFVRLRKELENLLAVELVVHCQIARQAIVARRQEVDSNLFLDFADLSDR